MVRYLLALSLAVVAGAAGCDRHERAHFRYGDCNPGGCFGCIDNSQGQCWPLPYDPCRTPGDCRTGTVCTTIGCAATCAVDDDCRQGEVCTAGGYCAPGDARTTPVGGSPADGGSPGLSDPGVIPCAFDGQCNAGQACVAGQCTHSPSCGIPAALCSTGADCGTGRACSGGLCHLNCGGSMGCPLGQVCSSGACYDLTPQHAECLLDGDCGATFRCINATCHPLCARDSQCGTGEMCDQGVCRADPRPAVSRK
jgi:hypothetical protein